MFEHSQLKTETLKIILGIFCLIAWCYPTRAQQTYAVRYQITPNNLLQLIEEYPDKKEKIETKIETEFPIYADIYIDSNRIIEVLRHANNTISIIRIFNFTQSTLLAVYPDRKSEIGTISNYTESTFIISDSIHHVTKDTLQRAYMEEKNSFPVTFYFIKDSLCLDQRLKINAAYPEHQLIAKTRHIPIKIIHGNPRPFLTYNFLNKIRYPGQLKLAFVKS